MFSIIDMIHYAKKTHNVNINFTIVGDPDEITSNETFMEKVKWLDGVDIDGNQTFLDHSPLSYEQVIENYDLSKRQKIIDNIREQRNKKLAESDWMANSDVSMSDEWRTYRQALRDITDNLGDLSNVQWDDFGNVEESSVGWPTKP